MKTTEMKSIVSRRILKSPKDHYKWLLSQRDEAKKALVELGKQVVFF